VRNTPDIRFQRDEDYVEAARSLLDAAVADAMRSVETPAIGLSSGLDSTTVAVTALDWLARSGDANAKPLLGLTAVPEPGWDGRTFGAGRVGDESGPVRALMARYPQLEVRFVDSAGLPIDNGLDHFQAASEMPLRNALNFHWGQELSRLVRADGRRVQLTGSSGNGTLSQPGALPVLSRLFRTGHWLHMVREMRAFSARRGITRRFGLGGLVDLAVLPNMPAWLYLAYRRWRPANFEIGFERFSAIHPDFARDMRVKERLIELDWTDTYQPMADRRAFATKKLDRGSRHHSGASACASTAFSGVEHRDPLGERRLIEFCYAIPDEQYFRDGVDRRLIRRVMADRLPPEILKAPRGRQAADWHLRLKRDAGRLEQELDLLEEDADVARHIDIPRLRAALRSLPEQTPLTRNDHPDQTIVMVGLPRAIALARFVRSVKGRNR
jgi:asparagine synthase (glutamine-hydrolysing)